MGTRLQQFLATPNGVQPNGTGSLSLPLGATYYNLSLDISDGATAMTLAALSARIKNIRLKLNGTQIRHYNSVDELVNINRMHGIETRFGTADGTKSARLVMFFAEPQRRTPDGEDALAWQCYPAAGVNSFTLEFDITSTASAAINVQVSREYAVIAGVNKFTSIVWHSSQMLPNSTAGKPQATSLPKTAYYRIHAYGGAGCLAGAQVKVDGLIIREFRTLQEYLDYQFANGLNAITDWLSVVFDNTNRLLNGLDVRAVSSFELQFTTATAGDIRLILEEIKGL